jgi:hypothetical protein
MAVRGGDYLLAALETHAFPSTAAIMNDDIKPKAFAS